MSSEIVRQLDTARVIRLDLIAFFGAFIGGLALYFSFRMVGAGQIGQTCAVVGVMIVYSLLVWLVPRLKVRLDQAGDNAYYLGLLFTLSSMAVALYEFSGTTPAGAGAVSRSGVEHIISNFGIALASTIAGIFLRVILHQMRVDPADVEGVSRIELADASKRVKASLDAASQDMALFHGQIAQRLADVVETARSDVATVLGAFVSEVSETTSKLLAKTEEAQSHIAEKTQAVVAKLDATAVGTQGAIARLSQIEAPPTKLAARLDKVTKSLESLDEPILKFTKIFESTSSVSAKAMDELASATRELTQFRKHSAEQQAEGIDEIKHAVSAFRKALQEAASALQTDKALVLELERQSKTSAEEALRAHDAANKVISTFTEVARDLRDAIRQGASTEVGAAQLVERAAESV